MANHVGLPSLAAMEYVDTTHEFPCDGVSSCAMKSSLHFIMPATGTSGMDASTPSGPDPAGAADRRRLTAVVYADLAGYSRLIGEDDAGTFSRLSELRTDLIDPAIARHGGNLVNTAGDSLLILFESILDAMRFTIEVQRAMPSFDGDHAPERRLRFRMGVNVGDVIAERANIHGEGITSPPGCRRSVPSAQYACHVSCASRSATGLDYRSRNLVRSI